MHEVLVNRLGGLSLPRKSVVRLTDRPDMTLDVYRGRKTTIQQQHHGVSTLLKKLKIYSELQARVGIEDNLKIVFLFLIKNICCDHSLQSP